MDRTDDESHETILDAREIAGEPFGEIISELMRLSEDGSLLLINSFEPEPLYEVLEKRGFIYSTSQVNEGEWHIEIASD